MDELKFYQAEQLKLKINKLEFISEHLKIIDKFIKIEENEKIVLFKIAQSIEDKVKQEKEIFKQL